MSSSKNNDNSLPLGWIICESKSSPGKKYYFNKKTGKSSWSKPQVQEFPSSSKKKFKLDKEQNETPERKKDFVKANLKRKGEEDSFRESASKRHRIFEKDDFKHDECKYTESSSANSRMIILRTKLAEETEREERLNRNNLNKSPTKCNFTCKKQINEENRKQYDPRIMNQAQTETVALKKTKSATSEHTNISPKSNELVNCTGTIHSPSGDGSPPSQFYTANKILTSMKAQLSECNYNSKPKDTFSFIEEGICNQMPEYPPTKHPSTPPQFSEVSKIVSAMKSKLSGKNFSKEIEDKHHNSANERLAAYRRSLNEEVKSEAKIHAEVAINPKLKKKICEEDDVMEVEYREERKYTNSSPKIQQKNNTIGHDDSGKDLILVVDTNVFIQEIDVIKNVINARLKGYEDPPTLLVPWRVINELDRLKDNNNGNGPVCKRARAAMDYLYQSLPNNDRIKVRTKKYENGNGERSAISCSRQPLRDSNSHIYPCESPDDEILNCCLQQAERGRSVLLLSNDKNFRNKATINNIKSINISELKQLIEEGPQISADPDLPASMKYYESCIYDLLSNILENEMRAKYDNLWQHVLFKAPPWSLLDVLQCLLKHWVAVFNEVFPRIQHLIQELKTVLQRIIDRGLNKILPADVTSFKELAIEVATKCVIIPEYMELAKLTVDRLNRTADQERTKDTAKDIIKVDAREADEKMVVIEAFENVWSVFSSYCAKLASLLGVTHDLEDKVCNDDNLEDLTSKWTMFSNQIYSFTFAIKGILSESNESHPHFEEQLIYLISIFRESLELIPLDSSVINRHNMRAFCLHSCELLRAAYTKFAQLTQLLDQCRAQMVNQ